MKMITVNGVRYVALDEESENFELSLSEVAKNLEEIVGEINDEDTEITEEDVANRLKELADKLLPTEDTEETKENDTEDEASLKGRFTKRASRRGKLSR